MASRSNASLWAAYGLGQLCIGLSCSLFVTLMRKVCVECIRKSSIQEHKNSSHRLCATQRPVPLGKGWGEGYNHGGSCPHLGAGAVASHAWA